MKPLKHSARALLALSLVCTWRAVVMADTSLGPDPYMRGLGFDLPQEGS